jgi:hypothetical protein
LTNGQATRLGAALAELRSNFVVCLGKEESLARFARALQGAANRRFVANAIVS